jgi:transcriptional regulator with XRE-family HTH domain
MITEDATEFWLRYKILTGKDLPVILKTGIQQSTLSTWKSKKIFPRVDDAYNIAEAISTTVDYLVAGRITKNFSFSPSILEIALMADRLTEEGVKILKDIAATLELRFHKENKADRIQTRPGFRIK